MMPNFSNAAFKPTLLITVLARSTNTGLAYNAQRDRLTAKGSSPVLMEPVHATMRLDRPGAPTVYVLDHDGLRTDKTLPVENGVISIDGVRDRALYYEVSYRK